MNIIEKASLRIAKSIRANYPEAASEDVLKFSLIILINTLSAIIISLIICGVTGHFLAGVIAIFSYTLLRFFSGGVHLSSSVSCCILSILIFVTIAHVSYSYWYTGFILDLISIIILIFTAPSGIDQVTQVDPKYYPYLKIISIFIVSINLFIHSDIVSSAFFIQAMLTTSLSYKVVYIIERRVHI